MSVSLRQYAHCSGVEIDILRISEFGSIRIHRNNNPVADGSPLFPIGCLGRRAQLIYCSRLDRIIYLWAYFGAFESIQNPRSAKCPSLFWGPSWIWLFCCRIVETCDRFSLLTIPIVVAAHRHDIIINLEQSWHLSEQTLFITKSSYPWALEQSTHWWAHRLTEFRLIATLHTDTCRLPLAHSVIKWHATRCVLKYAAERRTRADIIFDRLNAKEKTHRKPLCFRSG